MVQSIIGEISIWEQSGREIFTGSTTDNVLIGTKQNSSGYKLYVVGNTKIEGTLSATIEDIKITEKTDDVDYYMIFVSNTGDNEPIYLNSNLMYNPYSNSLVASYFRGIASSTYKLNTARLISNVAFDGTADITLNNQHITNGAGYFNSLIGGTNINTNVNTVNLDTVLTGLSSVTSTNFVGDLDGDITGNSETASKLQSARMISNVSFDGTANITLDNSNITNGAGYFNSLIGGTNINTIGNIVNLDSILTGLSSITSTNFIGNATSSTTSTTATNVVVNWVTDNTNYYLFMGSTYNTNGGVKSSAGLSYNPSTNILTCGTVTAVLNGNASSATSAGTATIANTLTITNSSSNLSYYIPFSGGYNSAAQTIYASANLSYNPNTDILSCGSVNASMFKVAGSQIATTNLSDNATIVKTSGSQSISGQKTFSDDLYIDADIKETSGTYTIYMETGKFSGFIKNSTTNDTFRILFTENTAPNGMSIYETANLNFNPNSGILSSTKFSGDGSLLTNVAGSSQWTTSGSDIYFNTGNVIMGLTSTADGERCRVKGTLRVDNDNTLKYLKCYMNNEDGTIWHNCQGGGYLQMFQNDSTNNKQTYLKMTVGSANSTLTFGKLLSWGGIEINYFYINDDGNTYFGNDDTTSGEVYVRSLRGGRGNAGDNFHIDNEANSGIMYINYYNERTVHMFNGGTSAILKVQTNAQPGIMLINNNGGAGLTQWNQKIRLNNSRTNMDVFLGDYTYSGIDQMGIYSHQNTMSTWDLLHLNGIQTSSSYWAMNGGTVLCPTLWIGCDIASGSAHQGDYPTLIVGRSSAYAYGLRFGGWYAGAQGYQATYQVSFNLHIDCPTTNFGVNVNYMYLNFYSNRAVFINSTSYTSDERIKKDIIELKDDNQFTEVFDKVKAVGAYRYKYRDTFRRSSTANQYGFIAQKVKENYDEDIIISQHGSIPNIMFDCDFSYTIDDDWVYTFTINYDLDLDKEYLFYAFQNQEQIDTRAFTYIENIKPLTKNTFQYTPQYEEKEVKTDKKYFKLELIGTYIQDKLSINKDKLFQLGWTATLGLINKVEKLEEENTYLKNKISDLENNLELIMEHLDLI